MSNILERWTLDDVDAVNVTLDGIDDSNARAKARAAAEAAKPRPGGRK